MDDGLLRVSVARSGCSVEISVAGEVDMSTVARLRQALDDALRQPVPLVVVDGRGLAFCDLSGVNCLMSAAFDLNLDGRRLVVRNANRSLRRLLEITGIDAMLLDGQDLGGFEGSQAS